MLEGVLSSFLYSRFFKWRRTIGGGVDGGKTLPDVVLVLGRLLLAPYSDLPQIIRLIAVQYFSTPIRKREISNPVIESCF